MNKLAMFVPLAKADAVQRLVYGFIDETPDRAGEVMDYASAKPAFQVWSEGMEKASGGRSLGNIRAQHDMKKAAGRLQEIAFNDELKRIEFCAHIVDDQEWAKVEAGVYTGFSPGGSYAKRWQDGQYRRYTPKVGELSIVDVPCIPTGTFTMVKADGVEEQVEFVMDKAYEPGNDATKARAEELAKADSSSWKDHVVSARAALIAENAANALAKMATTADDVTGGQAASPEAAGGMSGESELLDTLNAALAKADSVLVVTGGAGQALTATAVYASAFDGALLKSDIELPVAPPSPEAVALIGADLGKSIAAALAIRAAAGAVLEKGLYSLGDAVSSLQSFAWLTQDVTCEAGWEGDGSALPQMAVDIVKALKAFLIAMVEEEVSEMLSRLAADAGDDVVLVVEGDEMELAAKIIDLVKADTARMEKAGARNSRADSARIQAIHDKPGELGAACATDEAALGKSADLAVENEKLSKAVAGALPRLDAMLGEIESLRAERAADRAELAKMAEQITVLGGQPAPSKIERALMRDKAEDNGTLPKTDDAHGGLTLEKVQAMPAGPERSAALRSLGESARLAHHQTPA